MTRTLVRALMFMCAVFFVSSRAHAQADFPSRQITLVCGFAAGSGADVYARYFANQLAIATKQTVVVENRPGAAGTIALVYASKAKPDGYTIYIGGADAVGAVPYLFKQPPIDPAKDFEYISPLFGQGFMLIVDAKSPFKTTAELTEHLKKKGKAASYATPNNPSTILAEIYKKAQNLEAVQVAYKTSADYLNDLQSGSIDFVMSDPVFGLARIRDGSVRALGISTAKPISSIPDLQPLAGMGMPGVDLNLWWLTMVPKDTPKPVIDKLYTLFNAIASSQETRDFVGKNGGEPKTAGSPAETRKLVEREVVLWKDYADLGKIEKQ